MALGLLVGACASEEAPGSGAEAAPEVVSAAHDASDAPSTTRSPGIRRVESQPGVLGTTAYDCDDSTYVVAQLDSSSGGLWVFLPEETVLLPHVPAASGARYSNGSVTVWSKGMSAMVEVDGVVRRCTENRRASIVEDAKLRGNDFWAVGNEPGWSLEIGSTFCVLRTDYGTTEYTLLTPEPQVDAAARRTVYDMRVEDVDVRVVLEGQPCHDSMSGEAFETTVTVTVEGKTLRGCGQALH